MWRLNWELYILGINFITRLLRRKINFYLWLHSRFYTRCLNISKNRSNFKQDAKYIVPLLSVKSVVGKRRVVRRKSHQILEGRSLFASIDVCHKCTINFRYETINAAHFLSSWRYLRARKIRRRRAIYVIQWGQALLMRWGCVWPTSACIIARLSTGTQIFDHYWTVNRDRLTRYLWRSLVQHRRRERERERETG